MKKFLLLVIAVVLVAFFFLQKKGNNIEKKTPIVPTRITKQKITQVISSSKSIFVPYWTMKGGLSDLNQYDNLFYFGLNGGSEGIDKNDPGLQKISDFMDKTPLNKAKFLTIKISEWDENRQKIISDAVDIAKQYKFSGVVLDLELNSLFSDQVKNQITDFVQLFSATLKKENMKLYVALYGDTFYRKRPYDVLPIAKSADQILIMAYDFHKVGGEPGPNFPFTDSQKYGYDFQTMVDDFQKFVPQDKLAVIFGLYGYDWMVDEKKRPIKPAKALTLDEIRPKFLEKCQWQDCLVKRDNKSKETEVDYVVSNVVDNYGYLDYHVVWFEDEESVNVKIDYLKTKGIGNIAYWAWGYF